MMRSKSVLHWTCWIYAGNLGNESLMARVRAMEALDRLRVGTVGFPPQLLQTVTLKALMGVTAEMSLE